MSPTGKANLGTNITRKLKAATLPFEAFWASVHKNHFFLKAVDHSLQKVKILMALVSKGAPI